MSEQQIIQLLREILSQQKDINKKLRGIDGVLNQIDSNTSE